MWKEELLVSFWTATKERKQGNQTTGQHLPIKGLNAKQWSSLVRTLQNLFTSFYRFRKANSVNMKPDSCLLLIQSRMWSAFNWHFAASGNLLDHTGRRTALFIQSLLMLYLRRNKAWMFFCRSAPNTWLFKKKNLFTTSCIVAALHRDMKGTAG